MSILRRRTVIRHNSAAIRGRRCEVLMPVVTLNNAGKAYDGQRALEGVTLDVPQGKCLALIGHNGAGKTTLMKLILGLARPTSGSVSVLGVNPAKAGKSFRGQVGFLPENVAFHDELTGAATLDFYARLKGVSLKECPALLDRVGLSFAAARRVKTYSKGMRQRLGLAQALLAAPQLLLLDEPTSGLDPLLRHQFFEIIRGLTKAGTTVILASHILTELEARTDLVAILREGRLVAFGDIEELRLTAGLPVTVHVRGDAKVIAARLDGSFAKSVRPNGRSIDIDCAAENKMALLRLLTAAGEACADVEIHPPSLHDLYVYFGGSSAFHDAEQ
jgi:Cu-processing system ATP-binding protein